MTEPRLFCSHGAILFCIAHHPETTIEGLAESLVITPRTVWGLVGQLRKAGLIKVRREGRRHFYTVNDEAPFPDPRLSHLTLGQVVRALEL